MPKQSDQENSFVIDRLKNQTASAEGSNLPPRQIGQFRIPFVSNLRVIRNEQFAGQNTFTVAWDEPTDVPNISHYSVYIVQASQPNAPPLGPFNSQASPAKITISVPDNTKVTFLVVTVLNNGMSSNFQSSPTCTATASGPYRITRTTDATGTTVDVINLPVTTTLGIESVVVCRRTSGTAGTAEDGARIKLSAVFKNVAGIATQIGATTKVSDKDQAAWDANFTVSGIDASISVKVNGTVNNAVSWRSYTTTYQVSF